MFYDLSDENWRNSEIMQIFAAHAATQHPVAEYAEQDVPTGPPRPPAPKLSTSTVKYEKFVEKQAALSEIDRLTAGLRQAAQDAGMAGRVKAAYEIERTIAEIEQIGSKIIADENV